MEHAPPAFVFAGSVQSPIILFVLKGDLDKSIPNKPDHGYQTFVLYSRNLIGRSTDYPKVIPIHPGQQTRLF
jgi:hypothetical protein